MNLVKPVFVGVRFLEDSCLQKVVEVGTWNELTVMDNRLSPRLPPVLLKPCHFSVIILNEVGVWTAARCQHMAEGFNSAFRN